MQTLTLVHLGILKVVHPYDLIRYHSGVGIWEVPVGDIPDSAIFWNHYHHRAFAPAIGYRSEGHCPGAVAEEGNYPEDHDAGEYVFADGLCNS